MTNGIIGVVYASTQNIEGKCYAVFEVSDKHAKDENLEIVKAWYI